MILSQPQIVCNLSKSRKNAASFVQSDLSRICVRFRKETCVISPISAKLWLRKEKSVFLGKPLQLSENRQKERYEYEEQQPDQRSPGS
jgi:hypothetical protein